MGKKSDLSWMNNQIEKAEAKAKRLAQELKVAHAYLDKLREAKALLEHDAPDPEGDE